MDGCYFFMGSYLEKYGTFWKNGCFSGRIWPDWGNAAWADMAGLGSIGLKVSNILLPLVLSFSQGEKEYLMCSFTIAKLSRVGKFYYDHATVFPLCRNSNV